VRATWAGIGLILLIGFSGCKTPPPQLKPASTAEELAVAPPNDRRYDFPNYPKEALAVNTSNNQRGNNNGSGPGAGGMMGSGMGGMGGMGMGNGMGMAGR
jgi:hypothetical protein